MSIIKPDSSSHLSSRDNRFIMSANLELSGASPVKRKGRTIKAVKAMDRIRRQRIHGKEPFVAHGLTFEIKPRFQEISTTTQGYSNHITGFQCGEGTNIASSYDQPLDDNVTDVEEECTGSLERSSSMMDSLGDDEFTPLPPFGFRDDESPIYPPVGFRDDVITQLLVSGGSLQQVRPRKKVQFAEYVQEIGVVDQELRLAMKDLQQTKQQKSIIAQIQFIKKTNGLKKNRNYHLFDSRINPDLAMIQRRSRRVMPVYNELNHLIIERGFDKGQLKSKTSKEIFDILCAHQIITMELIVSYLRPPPGNPSVNIIQEVDFEGSPFW